MVTDINAVEEESNSRKWDDTFFDDDEDVIEVFDFDYPLMKDIGVKSMRPVVVSNALLIYIVALYDVVTLTIYDLWQSSTALVMYIVTVVAISSLEF